MSRYRASWALIFLMVLQSAALTAEAYSFHEPPASETVAQGVAMNDPATATVGTQPEPSGNQQAHQDCPHCCHCGWHAVASLSIVDRSPAPGALPPYSLSSHSWYVSAFFRPPKAA